MRDDPIWRRLRACFDSDIAADNFFNSFTREFLEQCLARHDEECRRAKVREFADTEIGWMEREGDWP